MNLKSRHALVPHRILHKITNDHCPTNGTQELDIIMAPATTHRNNSHFQAFSKHESLLRLDSETLFYSTSVLEKHTWSEENRHAMQEHSLIIPNHFCESIHLPLVFVGAASECRFKWRHCVVLRRPSSNMQLARCYKASSYSNLQFSGSSNWDISSYEEALASHSNIAHSKGLLCGTELTAV